MKDGKTMNKIDKVINRTQDLEEDKKVIIEGVVVTPPGQRLRYNM